MCHRKKDMNYEVLKGVSTDEIAQSLAEADYEAVRVLQCPLASTAVCPLSQHTGWHLLRARSVIHRC